MVQAGEMLGLVRAEVARILRFKCESISALYEGRLILEEGTEAWRAAVLFLTFYNRLYDHFKGDGAQMVHWLHATNRELAESPFILIIDKGELELVDEYLASC